MAKRQSRSNGESVGAEDNRAAGAGETGGSVGGSATVEGMEGSVPGSIGGAIVVPTGGIVGT